MAKSPEEMELLALAAYTSSSLKQIDSSRVAGSNSTQANRTDPRKFIKAKPQQNRQPLKQTSVPGMVTAPKSTPQGSEVVGKADFRPEELLIGVPDDMKEMVKAHAADAARSNPQQQHQQPVQQQLVVGKVIPIQENKNQLDFNFNPDTSTKLDRIQSDITSILSRIVKIEKKLNAPK